MATEVRYSSFKKNKDTKNTTAEVQGFLHFLLALLLNFFFFIGSNIQNFVFPVTTNCNSIIYLVILAFTIMVINSCSQFTNIVCFL